MAVLGADPDQLRDLARQMRVSGVVISQAAKRIGGQLTSSDWKGTDARDFGARWRSSEAQLVSSGQLLRGAADELDRNALEQEDASAAAGALHPAEPGPRRQPVLGARLPLSRHGFGTTIGVADLFGARNSNGWVVEDLPGGKSRVWDVRSTSVTVGAGKGGSVEIGPWRLDRQAAVEAELGYVHRTAKVVDDRDAARSAAWQTVENTFLANPLLNRAADWVEGRFGNPTFEDHLLLGGFGANAGFGAAAVALGASGAASTAIGWRDRVAGRSLLVEIEAQGEADVELWEGELAGSARVEFPPSDTDRQPVIAHTTTNIGGQVEERLITFELKSDEAAEVVDAAMDLLASGKPLDAAEELGDLVFTIDPSTLTVEERSVDATPVPLGFDGDIPTPAGPIGVEAAVEGFHETLE